MTSALTKSIDLLSRALFNRPNNFFLSQIQIQLKKSKLLMSIIIRSGSELSLQVFLTDLASTFSTSDYTSVGS